MTKVNKDWTLMTYSFRPGSKASKIVDRAKSDGSLTTLDLSKEFGCSRQYIHSVLKAAGMSAASPKRVWLPTGRAAPPPQSRLLPSSGGVQISHTATGSVSELLVAADLISRGWSVFFPLFRARSDLIATSKDGEVVLRLEVRSAKRRDREIIYNRKPSDACDHYALVVAGEPVSYRPDLPENKM